MDSLDVVADARSGQGVRDAGRGTREQKTNAADVFRRFGLESAGFLRSIAIPSRGDGSGPGKRLKDSFEQLGGLYLAFADFLLWRADLLGVDYLLALREIERPIPPS